MRALVLGWIGWLAIGVQAAAPATAPRTYRLFKDLDYQSLEPAQRGDLYLPAPNAAAGNAPAVVWMHGNHHDKSDAREREVGVDLAVAGYVCFSINYGEWPSGNIDAPGQRRITQNVVNAKNAVRFLRVHAAEYHIDGTRVALFGGSAGANLALLAGFTGESVAPGIKEVYPGVSSAVSAVGELYGFVDLGWLGPRLTAKSPAVLIVHGKEDSLLDHQYAVRLDRLLADKSVPRQLLLLDGVGHGFDFTTWNGRPLPVDLRPVVIAFLQRYVGPPAPPD